MSTSTLPHTDKVKNPCIGDCRLNMDEVCIGCGRSKDEKLDWIFYSEKEKQKVVITAQNRLEQLKSK
ncbi:DUF1289 domain-containing protein [Catenovulum sp. 2E275]|uniref:DUF1289 domain-containing protein n=1 Tax=Catenovulum sp. 2E275 TaxID=2980497 RepID=UPI0021CEF8E6|nr:DUF1289 domain-containing protein [Catenovulum sp. 2E275]MCU4677424.1 DUF1289 domain-containing protein [Catenovulum sp. 2E275]